MTATEPHKVYQYKVQYQWRNVKTRPITVDYAAPDLKSLLKMLDRAEGVSTQNTAFLVVHQINGDGSVTEVVAHDEQSNVIALRNDEGRGRMEQILEVAPRKRQRNVSEHRTRLDRAEASWWEKALGRTDIDQERTLDEVAEALKKARGETIPPVIIMPEKKKDKPRIQLRNDGNHFTVGGFFYKAVATAGWRRRPTIEESKKGVNIHA